MVSDHTFARPQNASALPADTNVAERIDIALKLKGGIDAVTHVLEQCASFDGLLLGSSFGKLGNDGYVDAELSLAPCENVSALLGKMSASSCVRQLETRRIRAVSPGYARKPQKVAV